jgi:hypothetical protein
MTQAIPQPTANSSTATPLLAQLMERAGITPEQQEFTMTWDELEGLYQTVAGGLVDQAISINQAISLFKQHATTINSELSVTIKGLTRDVSTMTEELVAIRKHHLGNTGPVSDDKISDFLTLGSDYKTAADRIQSLLVSPMLTVTEHLIEMQQQLKKTSEEEIEAKKQQDLLDPAVVSDVVVRETPVEEVKPEVQGVVTNE